MTRNTNKTMLLGIVTALAIGLSMPSAFANHGVGSGSWADGNVTYECLTSLGSLSTTSNVDPCPDIATAVTAWNNVNSTFDLNEVGSNGESTYGSADLASGTRGQNSNTVSNSGGSVMDYADISFNTDHNWSDRVGGDSWKFWECYDFISVATHESGHTVRLTHDSTSTLMKATHSCGEVYRTLASHDTSTVETKY
ncbi:MAG: matrixin family metalloprotease [Nitrosopumilaceae archaeon]|nr:matrixin family metalloprotease [Nitrosopumilaceae archaeon]